MPAMLDVPSTSYPLEVPMTETAAIVDRTLADSFPASDPPAWTGGGAGVRPARAVVGRVEPTDVWRGLPPPLRPPARHGFVALAGAVAVALLVPVFIVVLPFALLARAVMAAVTWVVVPPRPSG
jgi:hypothetical protein